MSILARVRVSLTGFAGGPGVSTFYCLDPVGMTAALRTMYVSLSDLMPANVVVQVAGSGDFIDSTDGRITSTWSMTPPSSVTMTQPGGYAAPSGAVLTWLTGAVLDGTRIRGRTFIVPLSGNNYQTDGTILEGARTTLTSAAAALVTATVSNFSIWHRPRLARAASVGVKALTAHPGGDALVTASVVHDRVAILRSRRD